jgi:hypothetical protein
MNVDSLITTQCDRCGEVELLAEQTWLVVAEPVDRSHFGFLCPGCEVVSRHRVDAETLAVLATLLPVEELDVPAEALETHDGPALTEDDLIDLMVGLDAAAEALGCRL